MIICNSCGEHNEDGTAFCVRCGVFLEWEGERVPDPSLPSEEAPAEELQPVPGAPAVAARQPEQAKKKRLAPRKPPANVPTGSLICGSCAMPNESSRRFCARCGNSLAEARVVRKTAWWRRLFGRERVYEPGTRRRVGTARRRARTVVRLGVVLALLGGVGVLAGPQRGLVLRGYHSVVDLFAKPEPARPVSTGTTGAVKNHAASLAFDGAQNTYWAFPANKPKISPVLRATFPTPVRLVGFALFPGVSIETSKFLAATRPEQIEIAATKSDGQVVVKRFPVEDKPGEQKFEFKESDITKIQLAVVSSRGEHKSLATAITELEFFKAR